MTHWYYDQNPNKLVDITIADSTLTADETTTVTLYFDRYVQGSRPGWFGAVRIVPIGVLEVPAGTQLSGPWSLNMNRAWAFTLTPPADTAQTRQILRLKSLDGVTDGLRKTVAAADFRIEYTVNTQRPTLAGATVDRFQLVLSYTDAGSLDATNKAGVDAFTVHGASGSTIAVSSVHVDATAKTVTLFLARAVRNGELVSVSYTDPTSGNDSKAIQNAVGNDAASFSNQAVVNNTPTDSLRPRLSVTGHTIDDDRLGIGQTAYVTIKFSEPVKGFDASDVVLAPGSGSVGQVSAAWQPGTDGSSDTWEVAIEAPGASSTNNPISVNLAGVSTRDGSATGRGTMATGLHYSVDTTRPTLLGTRISYGAGETDTILKRGETALVSFTFSEPVTDFGLNDVMLVNGLRDGVLSYFTSTGDGSVWTATLSAPSPGVTSSNNTFRVIMRGVNDRAGNAGEGVVATGVSYDLDTIVGRPSLRITLANTELRVGESTTVTFRFNEAVTGFDANAVVLTNASGTLSDLAVGADGKTWSATFTPTASTQDASNTIRVNLSGVSNGAGLTGAGSVSSANYTVDTWSPDTEAPVLGGAMVNGNQLVLSYAEAGRLDAAALAGNAGYAVSSTTGTAITVSSAVADTLAKTVTLTLSRAVTPAETVKVSYTKPESGAVVQDAAGNDAVSFSEQAVTNNSPPAEGGPRLPTLAASNPTTIDDDDPSLGARTTATIRFAEASAADEAGSRLPTLAATNPITIDNDNLSIGASTTVTIRFAEAIAADSFSTSDLSVGGYAKLSSLHSSDGGTTWTVTLTAPTERDIYAHFPSNIDKYNSTGNQIRVNLAGVSTPEGNAGVGQAVSTVTYDIDAMAPSVIITLGDDALTAGETTTVIFSFNEPVTGFDADDLDLTQANGTLGPLTALAGDRTWTATFTPTANVHTTGNKIIVKLDGVADFAGNRLSANILSGNYSIDTRPGSTNQTSDLSAGVTLTDGRLMTGEKASLIIAFNKPVNNFTLDDVDGTRANGTLSDLTRSADGRTWTATFTPTAGVIDETNTIRVNLAGVSDAAGTAATGSATSGNFIVSTALPAATITLTDTAFTTGETATVTFTFNQPVLGFTIDDIDLTQANGTLSAPTYTPGTDSKTWTATFTPNTNVNAASNTIRVNLTGVANMAGRSGTDAAISENYTVDTRPPDTTAPVFSSAAVTGNQLVISYTETNTLDAAALAGNAGYVVRSTTNTGLNWIYSVSSAVVHATNKTVTLTLSRAVTPTETVNVSYTKPATGAVVQDATGNDAANFSNLEVTNIPPAPADTTPPVLSSAVVNGNQLVLTYVEATGLDGAALVGNAGFTVHSAAGRAMTVTGAVVNRVDKSVTLMLSRTVVRGETVSASYVKPGAGNVVQDAAGNDAVNFSNWAVTNNTPEAAADTTPPVFSGAAINGDQLVLTYMEANSLDAAALAGNAGHTVNTAAGTTAITVSRAVVNAMAKTVTLILSRAVASAETVLVSYTKPATGAVVQDAAGNDAANFRNLEVTNTPPTPTDTTPPVLNSATVNGDQLVLTYIEASSLDGAALAGNAGFTVRSAAGRAMTVTGAMVNGADRTVTLTLSRTVVRGETVSVSYVKPGISNVVQDAAGNDAVNFSHWAVTNDTPEAAADTTPPVFSSATVRSNQLVI
uniref:SwmB domain-containing protein n=1 Tax=Verminephrobacter aporrectodeae TaxID=1110389 RepID=UPI001F2EC5DA